MKETTAMTLEGAYLKIERRGLTPIRMNWYVEHDIPVYGVSSVETYGPDTYNHPKMYVRITGTPVLL